METDCKGCLAIRKMLHDLKLKYDSFSVKEDNTQELSMQENIEKAQKILQDLIKRK